MFAACPVGVPYHRYLVLLLTTMLKYISSSMLCCLGFTSVREARNYFYTTCEVSQPNSYYSTTDSQLSKQALLHLGSGYDDIEVAQCALLLTYHAPAIADHTNTCWLRKAIQAARDAHAHQYNTFSDATGKKSTLKRLWWSCVLRDRVMSLSLRRPLEIKPGDFDFSFSLPGLTESDFEQEINSSVVYNNTTKRALVQLLALLCEFAVVMNDTLSLCYDPEPGQTLDRHNMRSLKEQVYGLDGWYDSAVSQIRTIRKSPGLHKSTSVFINAIYIYYL